MVLGPTKRRLGTTGLPKGAHSGPRCSGRRLVAFCGGGVDDPLRSDVMNLTRAKDRAVAFVEDVAAA